MTNDRAANQQANPDLSHTGLGDDLRSFLSVPVQPAPRQRNLRATFRAVPGDQASAGPTSDPGFPGTRAFAPVRPSRVAAHHSDRGAAGSALSSARPGENAASKIASSPNNAARRSVALQPAGTVGSAADGSAKPTAKSGRRGHVRGRDAGPSGAKPRKKSTADKDNILAALPKAIAKLIPKAEAAASQTSSRIVPTEEQRSDARRLFREIGERFNENRKKSKTAAYTAYRHDLMANLDVLIMGGAIDLKEVTTVITNLELLTKETEAESTETPATILGRWLRMDAAEVAALETPVGETVEDEEIESDEESEEESTEIFI